MTKQTIIDLHKVAEILMQRRYELADGRSCVKGCMFRQDMNVLKEKVILTILCFFVGCLI